MRRFLRPLALAAALLIASAGAVAEDVLVLPGALQVIEEEAFAGVDGPGAVILPEGVREIRARAFENGGFTEIALPATLESIADDAFRGSALEAVRAAEGSPAFAWALDTPYTLLSRSDSFAYAITGGVCALEEYLGGAEAAVPGSVAGCPVPSIGASLFAGHAELGRVTVPAEVETIAEGAFSGCAEDLLIRTSADSAAMAFAQTHRIDYQADTAYRALVIGQTYADSLSVSALGGTKNDADCLAACLTGFDGTPFAVSERVDLTADGILSSIRETFCEAREQDVSLFYYAGHGNDSAVPEKQGALIGTDAALVTVGALRAAMDEIPGRKILIIDACLSGRFVPAAEPQAALQAAKGSSAGAAEKDAGAEDADGGADAFVSALIGAFSAGGSGAKQRRGAASGGDYFIMTAAAADEDSFEALFGVHRHGLFTHSLLQGCGFDCATRRLADAAGADANRNGVLTFLEAYSFAADSVAEVIEAWNSNPSDPGVPYAQTAQLYPAQSGWFGLLRR